MKFIIMAGGTYSEFETPRQFIQINGEKIIERTIRLLRKNGVKNSDMFISSNNPAFDNLGIERKENPNNKYITDGKPREGYWVDAFYPMDEPCCYLFGDVYYSDEAIKTIVNTKCTDHVMFGNVVEVPGTVKTIKNWDEPLGFMVVNQERFKEAIKDIKKLWDERSPKLNRHPIAWQVYRYLNGYDLCKPCIKDNFININDYSTDVDHKADAQLIEYYLKYGKLPQDNKKEDEYYLYF